MLEYALLRRGPLTMAPSQLGLFTRSDRSRERANIQYHVQPLSLDKFGDPLHTFPAFTASVCNVQPTSRGALRLRSADAGRQADHPAELPRDRRGPPGRGRFDPGHPPHRRAARARPVPARPSTCPAPRSAMTRRRSPRRRATSAPRSSIPSAPPRWAATATRPRSSMTACASSASTGIRVVDASVMPTHHVRQHRRTHDDDRRKGCRDDPRGRAGVAKPG